MFRKLCFIILLIQSSFFAADLMARDAGMTGTEKQDDGDTLSVLGLIELSSQLATRDTVLALHYANNAMSLAEKSDETGLLGNALMNMGKIHYDYKDFVAASHIFRNAAEHFSDLQGSEALEAKAYFELGRSLKRLGKYAEALTAFHESYPLAESCGDSYLQADLMRRSANLLKHLGEYETAVEFAQACISISSMEGYLDFESEANRELGYIYNKQKLFPEAITSFRKALPQAATPRPELFADALEGIGNVYSKQDLLDSALSYFLQALRYRKAIEDPESLHILHVNIGASYEGLGDFDRARSFFRQSLLLAEQEQNAVMLGRSKLHLADLAFITKDTIAAKEGLLEALELLQTGGNRNLELTCLRSLQEFYEKQGDYRTSLFYMKQLSELKSSIKTEELSEDMENMRVMNRTRLLNDEVKIMEQEAHIRELETEKLNRRILLVLAISAILISVAATLLFLWIHKSRQYSLNEARNAELDTMNKELQELNRTKDRLFSIIGHDLKSPIHTIAGFNNLLQKRQKTIDEETQSRYLQNIGEATKNVSALLDDLLEWSKAQGKAQNFRQQQLDLNKLIRKNMELFRSTAGKKQISMEAETDRKLMVFADDQMVDTILRNLLNNAVKFTGSGGTISIHTREGDQEVEVSVTDTGVGMEPELVRNLFDDDHFTSRKGTNGEKGTGLGLIICKDFVEKHEGALRVSSVLGEGSTFIFDLPRSMQDDNTV